MDGCKDGILKTIVTGTVADVYDSFFLLNFGGSRNEGQTGRGAKCPDTQRQIQNFTYVLPRSMARERFDFLVEGSYYVVDVERVGGEDHGGQIETCGRVLQFVGVGHFSFELDVCPEVVLYCTKTNNKLIMGD